MKNLLITMSGGTTSVINATLCGIIKAAQESTVIDKIYAGFPGIVGFMNEATIEVTNLTPTELSILKTSPGSASIGTTRTKIFNEQDLELLKQVFDKYNIGYFINIGGNGTIKQTKAIASYMNNVFIAAAPKTVDNDLGDKNFDELWYTPGFPSCINYWHNKMQMLDNENIGACANDKVIVAQTFGRETGFLVGSLRMYDVNREKPIILLIPEDQTSTEHIMSKIENTLLKHNRAIIGICEGYKIDKYEYVYDQTNQIMYGSSTTSAMQQLINLCNKNNIQARGFNPTVDQRQNFNFSLDNDINISYNIGMEIINNFKLGKTHFFQTYTSSRKYKTIQLSKVSDYSRNMKEEWVLKNQFDVTDEYIKYLSSFTKIKNDKKTFVLGKVYER